MTRKKQEYERLESKAARGAYELVVPFDYMILEHLPEVGSLFAGMFPLGETVANIQKTLNKVAPKDQQLETSDVFGRMRSLETQGLVSQTKGAKSRRVWQRTARATKLYEEWKSRQGKEKQGGSATSS